MNREELLKLVDSLNLKKGDYYILSSGCMLLYGLRERVNDLDICVSEDAFKILKDKYVLTDRDKNSCGFYKISDYIECIVNKKIDMIYDYKDGYPVERLKTILAFKEKRNLPKDYNDIIAIKNYLSKNRE